MKALKYNIGEQFYYKPDRVHRGIWTIIRFVIPDDPLYDLRQSNDYVLESSNPNLMPWYVTEQFLEENFEKA